MGSVNLCCEVILIICILGECVAKVVLMSIVFCVKRNYRVFTYSEWKEEKGKYIGMVIWCFLLDRMRNDLRIHQHGFNGQHAKTSEKEI